MVRQRILGQKLISCFVPLPRNLEELDDLEDRDGLWWIKGQVFVPSKLCPRVLKEFHCTKLASHLGVFKTWEAISQTVTWLGIRKEVLSYKKSCFSCQRAKHSTQRPPGLCHTLSHPNQTNC
ncbi:putative retroelement pol polyprotein [Puccinia sorghi]|uniref:Putative retroelement pol polyprotein n=1 Tax=Puccinia sorghi TaxID=27349 RepID=A0A0L6VGI3_9BASI|nr:putative retroelement pol polyprotein [Puccinia sorghi]